MAEAHHKQLLQYNGEVFYSLLALIKNIIPWSLWSPVMVLLSWCEIVMNTGRKLRRYTHLQRNHREQKKWKSVLIQATHRANPKFFLWEKRKPLNEERSQR
jgi:hypothetical protein